MNRRDESTDWAKIQPDTPTCQECGVMRDEQAVRRGMVCWECWRHHFGMTPEEAARTREESKVLARRLWPTIARANP